MLPLLVPVLALQACSQLLDQTGMLDVQVPQAVGEACWELTCTGRMEIVYNGTFTGNVVLTNASKEVLRSEPAFGRVRFHAFETVRLTAEVTDDCAGSGCHSLQFAWGCLTDAPHMATPDVSGSPTSSDLVNPNLGYNHLYTPLVNTITCHGTVEMKYQMFYVGNFSAETGGKDVFATDAYGPHYGTTQFSATGNVSFVAYGRFCYRGGCGGFQYTWGCNMAAPAITATENPKYVPTHAPPPAPPQTPSPTPSTPSPPITPITPTPTSAGPCTTLSALSGTVGTSLPSGAETCWTLSCVGRLQITYNPKFDGQFVVENGTTTTLRTDAHYNSVTFNAYWDVKLTAAVNGCGNSDCGNRVEFSWGCAVDAPAIAAADTTDDADDVDRKRFSGQLYPDIGYDHYDTPLVNTISCKGRLELNYQLFFPGDFWVNKWDTQVFYSNAYGPHFGTTQFKADGNVSFLLQGRICYRGGCWGTQYSWGCNMAAPKLSDPNPAPYYFAPSCPRNTSLDTSGTVSLNGTDGTECWEIACEGGRAGIRFNDFDTTAGTDYVNVYEMEGDEITGFPFHESGEKNDTSYTFAGSVLVQFSTGWYSTGNSSLDFDYICMSGTGTPVPTLTPGGDDGLPVGAIVGICVGVVVLLVIIAVVVRRLIKVCSMDRTLLRAHTPITQRKEPGAALREDLQVQ